jgi:hypothetical protein
VRRRAADFEPDEMETARWVEAEACEPPRGEDSALSEPAPPPTYEDVLQSAETLELEDRIRLTSRLLMSLPLKHRAALVTFGLESLEQSANEALRQARQNIGTPFWPMPWRFLFDPANTSGLYAAPRRFDLATIFVVTAAYSLLFGALTALDAVFHFGPLPLVILGLVLAVVGITQAFCHGMANPRGASVVAGGGAFVLFYLLAVVFLPELFSSWFTSEIVIGLFFAPVCGYIAGVLVGGVFLIADKLRDRLQGTSATTDADANDAGDARCSDQCRPGSPFLKSDSR